MKKTILIKYTFKSVQKVKNFNRLSFANDWLTIPVKNCIIYYFSSAVAIMRETIPYVPTEICLEVPSKT